MTTPTNQPPQEPQSSTMRFGDLKKLITDTVEGITKAGQQAAQAVTGTQTPPAQRVPLRDQVRSQREGRSIDDEVSAALKKIEADKAREAREAKLDSDITELKEKTKEKAPLERGRMHKFMGWGE